LSDAAFVQIFPPLFEVGENVCNNFVNWAERRKEDISSDAKIEDKAGERAKVDEKIKGFRERFAFTAELRQKCEEAGLISPLYVPSSLSLSLSLLRIHHRFLHFLPPSRPPSPPSLCRTSTLHTDDFGNTTRGQGLRRVSTYQPGVRAPSPANASSSKK